MRVIKKYPNRRLYDTETSRYITLVEVHELIKKGVEFEVRDAESGDDITRTILVQIIIEQENGERPIFTKDMLTRFIRFYDEASHGVFGEFLDKNLQFFAEQQKHLQDQMTGMINLTLPKTWQEMAERNMSVWHDMQQRFFGGGVAKKPDSSPSSAPQESPADAQKEASASTEDKKKKKT